MGGVVVWYLLIINFRGGTSVIPQVNQQQCLADAAWLDKRMRDEFMEQTGVGGNAYCVPGGENLNYNR